MIYYLFGAAICFMASGLFFNITRNFHKRLGLLPPDIVYGKDYLGIEDRSQIVWQTPPLKIADDDRGLAMFGLFCLRWGFFVAGWFLTAAFLNHMVSK